MRVSVIGGSTVNEREATRAAALGRLLAQRGHTVVCGGLGGVMEAVCRGAADAGGRSIGILPTDRRADANEYVDEVIATGLGHARNALVVMNGDAVVAVDGGGGTLSELGYAAVYDRPTVGLGTHDAPHVEAVESAEAAVTYVESAANACQADAESDTTEDV
ncbi:TIGR00725 family protein [Halobellus clavatus]|jgi:uncharacterized protein (TIGR00725 family)|uniref:TIGR00725 family protein n=1 Tax=Halobellus clavatus TaxID=660517 RepID=A0A1H3CS86_9EURY|nr:TIGR00725 family protein [Halobellus clavatus]SDX56269.1 hypothetical protein SAMN04487946_101139 [Halobellus clavatus]